MDVLIGRITFACPTGSLLQFGVVGGQPQNMFALNQHVLLLFMF